MTWSLHRWAHAHSACTQHMHAVRWSASASTTCVLVCGLTYCREGILEEVACPGAAACPVVACQEAACRVGALQHKRMKRAQDTGATGVRRAVP